MSARTTAARAGAWLSSSLAAAALCLAAQPRVEFSRDVQPIFQKHCLACHGAQQQMSGLRLDRGENALRGGYSGPVIRPGDSAGSRLIRLVSGQEKGLVMPPAGARLTASETGALRAWIDQGATWPAPAPEGTTQAIRKPASSHWAFQPLRRSPPPAVRGRAWVRNAVDAFVLARLEAEGLEPSPEADKNTLIRRLSLDLTGLPPTPRQVADFLADNRPNAYEHVVDALLASPHYGEKWARHWLDLAQYADSDGYEKDRERPHAWRFRHWAIEALNRDLPFDQFTIEQLAGDLLPNAAVEQKVATGFLRNTLTNREAGVDRAEARFEQVVSRANTVGTVWLGLTVGCAQCHDHKYDPISQRDYYQLFAFFDNTEEADLDAPLPGELGPYWQARPEYYNKRNALLQQYRVPEVQAEWEKGILEAADQPGKRLEWDFAWTSMRAMFDGAEKLLRLDPGRRAQRQKDRLADYFVGAYGSVVNAAQIKELKFRELRDKLAELEAGFPAVSQAPAVEEQTGPSKTHLRLRGDYREKGVEVQPATPAVLPALSASPRPSRLDLARWLVTEAAPLTARVTVNRLWQDYFGRGLVRTSEDFGAQGERPSHPELLDWLAGALIDHGWSWKQAHRLIVASAAYRQSSAARPDLRGRDPDNVFLARQSRLRLPAELIRDSALASSGLLHPAIGGRSVKPPQPAGVSELSYSNSVRWKPTPGMERYRRGLYVHYQRTSPYPQMSNFDAPEANVACSRRRRSNTPLQALNLLNDPVFFEAAQGLAARVLREAPAGFAHRLDYAYQLCLGRPAGAEEKQRLARFLEEQIEILRKEPESAEALFPNRLEGIEPLEAAAWTALGRVLLNLDEFITRQ